MTTHTIALIAFGGNVVVGVLAVLVTYAGMERSIPTGAVTAVATGLVALFIERHLGQQFAWSSWSALEVTAIAAILGAFVGVTLAILVWRPQIQRTAATT